MTEIEERMREGIDAARARVIEIEEEIRKLREEQGKCKLIVASAEGNTTLKRKRKDADGAAEVK